MSRAYTTIVIPAEKQGWEVWESTKSGFEKAREVEGSLKDNGLDSGGCIILPVNAVATLPMIVHSVDDELCRGAAQMALEKSGLILEADENAWDSSIVFKDGTSSLVAGHAFLEDVFGEGDDLKDVDLDYSPRCYEVGSGDVIACWLEQGRWALVCYKEGKPFYAEPLGKDLDNTLLSAILQLDGQMMVAGINFDPEKLVFWNEVGAVRENQWSEELGLPVISTERPMPKLSDEAFKVRTEGMVEWERKRKAGSKNKLWIGAITLVYLIAGGLIFWNFRELDRKIDDQKSMIQKTAGISQASTDHTLKWEALDDLVKDRWPLEVYKKCFLLRPRNSAMRFQDLEIHEDDRIVLKGYAPSLNPINEYIQRLRSDPSFTGLKWDTPAPVENPKTKVWEFDFEASFEEEIF